MKKLTANLLKGLVFWAIVGGFALTQTGCATSPYSTPTDDALGVIKDGALLRDIISVIR